MEPPEELADVTPLCQRIASAVQAGEDPTDALDALLQGSVDVLQRPVAGWIAEVVSHLEKDGVIEVRRSGRRVEVALAS